MPASGAQMALQGVSYGSICMGMIIKKKCEWCGNSLPSWIRKDGKFCSASCRQFNLRGQHLCPCCGLAVVRLIYLDDQSLCPSCAFDMQVKIEMRTLDSVITWARETNSCIYCGDIARHVEHVIPRDMGMPTYTVPSCAECNLLANKFYGGGVFEKQDFIHKKIRKRYSKLLAMPEWDQTELDELKGRLRLYVEGSQVCKRFVVGRLSWSLRQLAGVQDDA